jgi:hypothetical protein
MIRVICILVLLTIMLEGNGQDQSIYGTLKAVAIKLNRTMPRDMDQYTRIDSLTAIPNDTLQYSCSVFHLKEEPSSVHRIKSFMEDKMLHDFKTAPEFKAFRDNRVTLVYKYYNEKRIVVFSIFLTPEKYER